MHRRDFSSARPQPPRLPCPAREYARRRSIPPAPSPSSIRSRPAAPSTWWRGRWPAVLEPILKQPVVIETKAGAAGQVGAQFAAAAKPDGYTLLMHIVSISGFAEVDKLYGRPVKFTRDDFIPIARFIADPMVLVVNDQQPYKTLTEFVDDAKKRPNELIFSSSGLYGALHLPTALFMQAAGVQMKHLPTNGGGPALTAHHRQQLAGAVLVDRGSERADAGRQAHGRWPASAPSARPPCLTCPP